MSEKPNHSLAIQASVVRRAKKALDEAPKYANALRLQEAQKKFQEMKREVIHEV